MQKTKHLQTVDSETEEKKLTKEEENFLYEKTFRTLK